MNINKNTELYPFSHILDSFFNTRGKNIEGSHAISYLGIQHYQEKNYYEDKNQLKLGLVVTFFRLVVHPLVAFIIIILTGGYEVDSARTTLMVAAAPVGLMAFTFAPKYKVRSEAIAISIFWTLIGSLFLIPFVGIMKM